MRSQKINTGWYEQCCIPLSIPSLSPSSHLHFLPPFLSPSLSLSFYLFFFPPFLSPFLPLPSSLLPSLLACLPLPPTLPPHSLSPSSYPVSSSLPLYLPPQASAHILGSEERGRTRSQTRKLSESGEEKEKKPSVKRSSTMAQTAKVLVIRAVAFCVYIQLPLIPYESQPNSGLHKASKEFVFCYLSAILW